jgi:ribosome maturation factor RimP
VANSSRDIHLEVSSPGISRRLKTADELMVFQGRGIKYLIDEESDWRSGTIGEVGKESVIILAENEAEEIQLSRIKRIKLDDTQRSGGRQ